MFRHILKLIWNKKRMNALIILEVFISFLVVFAVTSVCVHYALLYRHPLGFSYERVWALRMDPGGPWQAEDALVVDQAMRVIRELDPVEAIAGLDIAPFRSSTWTSTVKYRDRTVSPMFNRATDGLAELIGLELIEGRWFGPQDDGLAWNAVVIDRQLRDELFGDDPALGQDISGRDPDDPEESEADERRVVGVLEDFRQKGELHPLRPYVFVRYRMGQPNERDMNTLHVKVREGTTAAFEEQLLQTLQAVAPTWEFQIKPWAHARESMLESQLTPVLVTSVVTGFLMLMVALGLLGVLWQNVTRRTAEMGLRRAMGAAVGRIRNQIAGELLMITTLGVGVGVLVAVQFPLLGVAGFTDWVTSAWSLTASVVLIYLLALVCALYPSWLATRIEPADALHYE